MDRITSAWGLCGCQRGHPHEDMDDACKRFSDYEERLCDGRMEISRLRRVLFEIRNKAENGYDVREIIALCVGGIPE